MIRSPKITSSLVAAVLAVCGATASVGAYAADKVTVQLKWLPQAQFAGYYVAQAKGYYKEAGLDVTIKPGGPDISPVQVIAGNQADVVVNWMPDALAAREVCFFPVTVAMVQGLRSPQRMETEMMHTYAASNWQALWLLRLPAALPFLFPALRVGIAAGLVGAMVAELPTGAVAGLGARLLTGSYYGNTIQIWSALVMSALLGLTLTSGVALIEWLVLRNRSQP